MKNFLRKSWLCLMAVAILACGSAMNVFAGSAAENKNDGAGNSIKGSVSCPSYLICTGTSEKVSGSGSPMLQVSLHPYITMLGSTNQYDMGPFTAQSVNVASTTYTTQDGREVIVRARAYCGTVANPNLIVVHAYAG